MGAELAPLLVRPADVVRGPLAMQQKQHGRDGASFVAGGGHQVALGRRFVAVDECRHKISRQAMELAGLALRQFALQQVPAIAHVGFQLDLQLGAALGPEHPVAPFAVQVLTQGCFVLRQIEHHGGVPGHHPLHALERRGIELGLWQIWRKQSDPERPGRDGPVQFFVHPVLGCGIQDR